MVMGIGMTGALIVGASAASAAPAQTAAPAGGNAAAPAQTSDAQRAPASADDATARKLRAAVAENVAKLGTLEPWQQKIFEDEALPQYQRFVRNYRSAQTHSGTAINNLIVDIDLASLKNYLQFYAPKSLARDPKKSDALVYLKPEAGCEKCAGSEAVIRKLVSARVARRGFNAIWLTAEDFGASTPGADGAQLAGKALEDKIAELAQSRDAAAALTLQWGNAPVDDVDSVHAGEKHYVLRTALQLRGRGSSRFDSILGTADLQEIDPFETSVARLMSDAFTQAGADTQKAEVAAAARSSGPIDSSEIDIDVTGIEGFGDLTRLKTQIQGKFAGATVEERKISRGRAMLALTITGGNAPSINDIKQMLTGLSLEPGKLQPTGEPVGSRPASDEFPPVIAMEIRK